MAFFEVQFPPDIAYGASGGPGWLTRVVSTQSGFEYRNQQWSTTRGAWNVSHGIKSPAQYQELKAFWFVMKGKTHGFRYKDWTDFTDGGAGTFQINPDGLLQLAKTYSVPAGPSYTRFISKPVPSTLVLPGGVAVDPTTGLVTGGSVGQVWTGEFDNPARFDTDKMDMTAELPWGDSEDGGQVVASWGNIMVVEIRIKTSTSRFLVEMQGRSAGSSTASGTLT